MLEIGVEVEVRVDSIDFDSNFPKTTHDYIVYMYYLILSFEKKIIKNKFYQPFKKRIYFIFNAIYFTFNCIV